MITQSTRRPLSSWKAVLRRARQHRQHQQFLLSRTMATETTSNTSGPASAAEPPPPSTAIPTPKKLKFHAIKSNIPNKPIRTAFAVYPRVPSAREAHPALLTEYHAQQIRRLDRTGARRALFSKANRDAAKPGDVLQVTTTRGEPFAGVLLSIRRAGVETAILLRNQLTKVGVEMWYKVFSPNVLGIEVVWRRPKRARRARLTYMRKPKHDMGSIDHLVDAWRRTRNVFSSKSKGTASLGRASKHAKGGGRR
ncbi:translation protein SH3-like domain-containing protein [Xylariaceae sp. FL0662B]|nr:translation protein SH3-like domain-containing protein [Xylariaceae sp. FL0662B]